MPKSSVFNVNAAISSGETDRRLSEADFPEIHHLLEAEKVRLSRDLHDALGQPLTVLKMGIAEIARTNPENMPAKAQCRRLIGTVDEIIDTVRSICSDLHPALLETAGLFPALEWYFARFEKQSGLRCRWRRSRHEPPIPLDTATHIFRIVQEALTNAVRHAQATAITIDTEFRDGELNVGIRDDGIGIPDTQTSDARSNGMQNMKERARLLGARLNISGSLGHGTLIELTIPLSNTSTRAAHERAGSPRARRSGNENVVDIKKKLRASR